MLRQRAATIKPHIMTTTSQRSLADPALWSAGQVAQWLSWAAREFSLEGVKFDNFSMTGKELLRLGRDAFLARSPPFVGDILWEHLEILQKGVF